MAFQAASNESRRSGLLRHLPPLLLMAATLLVYWNSRHDHFFFDSDSNDLLVRPARDWQSTLQGFRADPLRPGQHVTYLTFAFSYAVNRALGYTGLYVPGFWIFNVILHGLNACLVYWLVRAFLRQLDPDRPPPVWMPAALAGLFAVHPIHAAGVVYIIQRRGELAATFYLAGVLCYLRSRRSLLASRRSAGGPVPPPRHVDQGMARRYRRSAFIWAAAIPVFYWLAYQSKEVALTLPVTLVLLEFCLQAPRIRSAGRYWTYVLGGIVLYLGTMLAGLWAVGRFKPTTGELSAYGEAVSWGVWGHFLSMCRVFAHFWKLLLLPLPQWSCLDHGFQVSFSLWQHGAAFALALHLALLWLGFFAARRGLVLAAAGIVWFYAVQLPYMFLPQRELYVEYKAYLPSIGIVLLLADLFRLADRRFGLKLLPAVLVIPLVILGAVTVARNVVYQTPLNLWSDVVAKNPNHYRPHNNLGTALLDLGRYDEAERELRTSLGYWPTNSACYNNLGLIRMKQERYGEARELLLTAIRCWPDSPNAHFNLGNTEWALKRPEAAEKAYREALRLVPDHPQSYNNLANVLAIQGKTDEAIQCYRRALECEPNYLDACKNLVELLMRLNRRAEAAQYYGRLVRLMPAQPVRPLAIARNDYAAVLHETGRTPEAVEQFAEACRLDPGYVQPRFNLATILLSQERWAEAEARYQEVIALDPAHQQAHIRRGFALEKLGRRSEAGAEYRRALELKPTDAQAAWNLAESLADSDKANALIWYQLVCRLEPRNVAALIRAADLLAEQGRRDEAVLLYQAALSVKPDHPRALQQVAAMGTRPAGSAPATPPAAPGEGASSRPR